MRERLIQLITQKQDVGRVYSQATSVVVPNKELAEHLLANGVVVGDHKQSEGEWKLEHETYGKMCCSVCGKECPTERKPDPYEDYQMTDFYVMSPFCPNCGAKMKGT